MQEALFTFVFSFFVVILEGHFKGLIYRYTKEIPYLELSEGVIIALFLQQGLAKNGSKTNNSKRH